MSDDYSRPSPTRAVEASRVLFISDQLQELLVWMLRDKVEHSTIQEVVEKHWHYLDLLDAHRADPTRSATDVLDDLARR